MPDTTQHHDPQGGYRTLIIPSDPKSLTGARGDEAMLCALQQAIAEAKGATTTFVLTGAPAGDDAARSLGLVPIRKWREGLSTIRDTLLSLDLHSVWIIGADVMDGHYDALATAYTLAIADLSAGLGLPTTITGFSFNDRPDRRLRRFYDALDPRVRLCVRDELSFTRIQEFTSAHVQLAADIALLLQPLKGAGVNRAWSRWIAEQRSRGQLVVVVNIHPMLLGDAGALGVSALVARVSEVLRQVLDERSLSVLLMAHDHRGLLGDDVCLGPLYRLLSAYGARVHYSEGVLPAAEIKCIAGSVDAVVTGRMHLAVASLGMGTPTAGITYQDKFEGLFDLFGVSKDFLVSPADVIDKNGGLLGVMLDLIDHLDQTKDQLRASLPTVLDRARTNLSLVDAFPSQLPDR